MSGTWSNAPRVLGATNREELKAEIEAAGVTFDRDETGGGIIGAAGSSLAWEACGELMRSAYGRDERVYCRPDERGKRAFCSLKTHLVPVDLRTQRPRSRDGESCAGLP